MEKQSKLYAFGQQEKLIMNRVTKKSLVKLLCVLALCCIITSAVVEVIHATNGFFTSKECPPLAALQARYADLTKHGGRSLNSIVGKARVGTDSWIVYYIRADSAGNLQLDDDIVLTKLDTDVWIMKVGDVLSGSSWGLVSDISSQVPPQVQPQQIKGIDFRK